MYHAVSFSTYSTSHFLIVASVHSAFLAITDSDILQTFKHSKDIQIENEIMHDNKKRLEFEFAHFPIRLLPYPFAIFLNVAMFLFSP
jgi:hypothetical protein